MRLILISIIGLILQASIVDARWECYQQMTTTEEVTMQASSNDTGSSMYTSDGYLKTSERSRANTSMYRQNGRLIMQGNNVYQSGSDVAYRRVLVPHYYTICEEDGRVVSIIEHQ